MNKKGFTLVELIVVITILAILGTIAFISLNHYNNDAKNTKVGSDLRNITAAFEAKKTKDSTPFLNFLSGDTQTENGISGTFGSGITIDSSLNYGVGNIDFAILEQNGTEFKDPNANNAEYLFSYVNGIGYSGYQVAGQIIEDDIKYVRILGNYYPVNGIDTIGLIRANIGGSGPLLDGDIIGSNVTDSLY